MFINASIMVLLYTNRKGVESVSMVY